MDIVEAADEVLAILCYWAEYFGDDMDYRGRRAFPAGVDSADAHRMAQWPASFLLEHLDEVVNDTFIRLMCEKVLGPTADPDDWTIAGVSRRWSIAERPKWSPQPCPGCEMKTIQVRPPRREGDERQYVCQNDACTWRIPEAERVQWMVYFGEGIVAVVEESEPQVHPELAVAGSVPARVWRPVRSVGELNLTELERDLSRKVCGECWLLMPCGCEGVAA